MPIHFAPLSRRSFLAVTGAAVASLQLPRIGWSDEAKEADSFALLADTHIPDRPDFGVRDINMTDNFRQVIREVCALESKPLGVIVNGDCAYLKGLSGDYANFSSCVAPIMAADLNLHLTMGNHDNRAEFYAALTSQRPANPPVESKHVNVIESAHVNLFLLDSLQEVNVVTGELGQAQRAWLARMLDERSDKPAIVVAHHNPQFEPPAEGARWSGLQDSADFFELLKARKHVKAYVFGHTHNWSVSKHGGLHLINLPPVAYVFAAGKPNGWVHAHFSSQGVVLELRTIDPNHPQHGQRIELAWS